MRTPNNRIDLNRYLIALLEANPGGGFTPPAGAEGDLLVFHAGAWQTVIAPGAVVGQPLTSNGAGAAPTYQAIQRTPIGPVAFVDPANSTGFASDSNTGANATNTPPGTGPILTTLHANTLVFNRFLTSNRTIAFMSDDTSGIAFDTMTLDQNLGSLTVAGTPQIQHTGGTLNTGTITINPTAGGGGQRQVVHTSDLVSFAPFIPGAGGHIAYWVHDTATNGSAWVMSATTPASPSMTRPAIGNSTGTLTIGDAYTVQRGSVLVVAGQFVSYQDLEISGDTGVGGNDYIRCAVNSVTLESQYDNCYINRPFIDGTIFVNAGGANVASSDKANIVAASDVYFTNSSLFIDPQHFLIEVQAGFGAGIQVQDMAQSGLTVLTSWDASRNIVFGAGGFIWGNGNGGVGIAINTGATITVDHVQPPTVTGAGGDFVFLSAGGGATTAVARAVIVATGAYTEAGGPATRATTWANFATAIGGGGFGFQAHYAEGNSAIIGN